MTDAVTELARSASRGPGEGLTRGAAAPRVAFPRPQTHLDDAGVLTTEPESARVSPACALAPAGSSRG